MLLQQAHFGHGHGLALADDQVIEHAHVDETNRIGNARCDGSVGGARLGNAGGMIVGQDDRGAVEFQAAPDDFTRMYLGGIHRTEEQFSKRYDSI